MRISGIPITRSRRTPVPVHPGPGGDERAAMVGRLIERGGDGGGQVYLLGPEDTAIGRDQGNDVVLPSTHVSRQHAQLQWDGDRYLLCDLGSKNGTFLNGARITAPV